MAGMFDQFWQDQSSYDQQHPVQMVKVRVDESPNFSLPILKQNVDNINNLSRDELKDFIYRCYDSIVKNLFDKDNAQKYARVFQNIKFLDVFIEVSKDVIIDSSNLIRLNTMCYDYITLPKEMQDTTVVNRMLQLSSIINRAYIPRLCGLGLSSSLASMLLIARFSDTDLNICVKRVNFIIINQPKELMSTVMIEEILRNLYNVLVDFYRIFPYFMIDIIPEYDEYNENTLWVTEDIDKVNSRLNLAMLNILNSLPSNMIRSTLINYSEAMRMVYVGYKVRFSLRTLNESEYYRINTAIQEITYTRSDIYVP